MGQVTFTTTFSGGNGTLDVSFDNIADELQLTPKNTTETVTLPVGDNVYTVSGDSPHGPGGNINLKITGDVMAEINKDFPSGLIDSDDYTVIVAK